MQGYFSLPRLKGIIENCRGNCYQDFYYLKAMLQWAIEGLMRAGSGAVIGAWGL